jgi:hypothetical protein
MLIIDDVFQIKNFMPLFLKGEKKMSWVLVTQKMKSAIFCRKKTIVQGTAVSLKNGLKKMILGY